MKITSIEKPDQGATIWSGMASIGKRRLIWFYWPRHWLRVREQQPNDPRCWLDIEPPDGAKQAVLKTVREAGRGSDRNSPEPVKRRQEFGSPIQAS